jgi:hypothetical protein
LVTIVVFESQPLQFATYIGKLFTGKFSGSGFSGSKVQGKEPKSRFHWFNSSYWVDWLKEKGFVRFVQLVRFNQ